MKVITLTLNPAVDVHCRSESLALYRENTASIISRDPGGKGINISRALRSLGVENTSVLVVGDDGGDEFLRALAAEGLKCLPLAVSGRIRENITVHADGKPETRISFTGFSADDSLIDKLEKLLEPELSAGVFITFSGKVPQGISHGRVMNFLKKLSNSGARLIVDSHALDREDIVSIRPWLIKPNEEEMEKYIGGVDSDEQIAAGAHRLRCDGVENVMITLGARGAVLACGDGVFFARAPEIEAASTVGAGDSSIAGFITGRDAEEALRLAVGAGCAACLEMGTRAPSLSNIEILKKKVMITKIR